MVVARPFENYKALKTAADHAWSGLMETDYIEAFAGHPKIGDLNSLRQKYSSTKELANGEQSAVNNAPEQILEDLSAANDEYEKKFGFIFIVCATGKSAAEMLALLQARLTNDKVTELINGAEEQCKILQIRLDKLTGE